MGCDKYHGVLKLTWDEEEICSILVIDAPNCDYAYFSEQISNMGSELYCGAIGEKFGTVDGVYGITVECCEERYYGGDYDYNEEVIDIIQYTLCPICGDLWHSTEKWFYKDGTSKPRPICNKHAEDLLKSDSTILTKVIETTQSLLLKNIKQEDVNHPINIFIEGNNGGDYIKILQTEKLKKEELIYLEVGHSCVVFIKKVLPVSLITAILAWVSEDGIEKYLPEWNIAPLYLEELMSKIKDIPGEHFLE